MNKLISLIFFSVIFVSTLPATAQTATQPHAICQSFESAKMIGEGELFSSCRVHETSQFDVEITSKLTPAPDGSFRAVGYGGLFDVTTTYFAKIEADGSIGFITNYELGNTGTMGSGHVLEDGTAIFTGSYFSGISEVFTARIDANGKLLNRQRYSNKPAGSWGDRLYVRKTGWFPRKKTNYLILGHLMEEASFTGPLTAIWVDENGKFIKNKIYKEGKLSSIDDAVELPNGDIILLGWDQARYGGTTIYLTRLSNEGEIIWEKPVQDLYFAASSSMHLTKDGNLLIAGAYDAGTDMVEDYDVFATSYNTDGKRLWKTHLAMDELSERSTAITQFPNGDIFLAAEQTVGYDENSHPFFLVLDTAGKIQAKTFPTWGSSNFEIYDMRHLSSGAFMIWGKFNGKTVSVVLTP